MSLTAYRVPPQQEHKAAKELREAGNRAYVPRKRLRRPNPWTGKFWPVAPGYVFSDDAARIAFAKHVRSPIGQTNATDLARLYERRDRGARQDRSEQFAEGDQVRVAVGRFADLSGIVRRPRRDGYMIGVELLGKLCDVFVPAKYLQRTAPPHDPG